MPQTKHGPLLPGALRVSNSQEDVPWCKPHKGGGGDKLQQQDHGVGGPNGSPCNVRIRLQPYLLPATFIDYCLTELQVFRFSRGVGAGGVP